MDRGENNSVILTSVLILVTFPWADSLFCFRKARDERLRPGSRQRKGCDGFREEDLSPVATKGCRGGPPSFTGHSSTTRLVPKFSSPFLLQHNQSRFFFLTSGFAFFTIFYCVSTQFSLSRRNQPSIWRPSNFRLVTVSDYNFARWFHFPSTVSLFKQNQSQS